MNRKQRANKATLDLVLSLSKAHSSLLKMVRESQPFLEELERHSILQASRIEQLEADNASMRADLDALRRRLDGE